MKALAPIFGMAFLVGASSFARMQHTALHGGSVIGVLLVLSVAFGTLRFIAARRTRLQLVDFDEAPASYQRLDLNT